MSNNKSHIINIPNFNTKELITDNKIIDDEDDDTIKLNKNNNYDINKQDNNKSQIQTELSTILNSSSNLNEYNEIDTNKANILGHLIKENEQQYNYSNLLYGNSINDLTPKHLGKLFAFFYINQKPLIMIGPDYKKNSFSYNIYFNI